MEPRSVLGTNIYVAAQATHLAKVVSVLKGLDFDLDALLVGQGPLGLFHLSLEFTHGTLVRADVGSRLALVLLDEMVDDPVVKVFSSQVGVTGGRENLEHALFDGEEGDVESTTTEIVDDDLRLGLAGSVKTVGYSGKKYGVSLEELVQPRLKLTNSSGGGLVDNPQDGQTGDRTGILGSLPLSVVEV